MVKKVDAKDKGTEVTHKQWFNYLNLEGPAEDDGIDVHELAFSSSNLTKQSRRGYEIRAFAQTMRDGKELKEGEALKTVKVTKTGPNDADFKITSFE